VLIIRRPRQPGEGPAPARPSDRGGRIAALVVLAVLLVVYTPVFAHAVEVWSLDEEFSFAFLVPPISAGLFWLRRDSILRSVGRGSDLGLLLLAGGLLVLVAGARAGVHAVEGASFVVTALGVVAYLYGVATARRAAFPIAFLAFGLCLYRGLLVSVGFFLQNLTARLSARAAALFGVTVHRVGVDLFAGQFHFVVAEACSGMSSLLALLCLGTAMVGLAQSSLPRRALLLLLIVPIVLVANIFRVTLVLTLAQVVGLAVVNSIIHGAFSAIIFLIAFGLFLLMGKVLGCYPRIGALLSS